MASHKYIYYILFTVFYIGNFCRTKVKCSYSALNIDNLTIARPIVISVTFSRTPKGHTVSFYFLDFYGNELRTDIPHLRCHCRGRHNIGKKA